MASLGSLALKALVTSGTSSALERFESSLPQQLIGERYFEQLRTGLCLGAWETKKPGKLTWQAHLES